MLHKVILFLGILAVIFNTNNADDTGSNKHYKFYQIMNIYVKGVRRQRTLEQALTTEFKVLSESL